MSGLGRVMPWTFGAFALASLSMIGAPPVAGFITKWYLLNGAMDAHSIAIVMVLLASTLLNAAYFVPVIYQGFFGETSQADLDHKFTEAHPSMVIPLAVTAAISVFIGLYPMLFTKLLHLITPSLIAAT
jgi:multicomponent Na+:H+ antiporter subunit D